MHILHTMKNIVYTHFVHKIFNVLKCLIENKTCITIRYQKKKKPNKVYTYIIRLVNVCLYKSWFYLFKFVGGMNLVYMTSNKIKYFVNWHFTFCVEAAFNFFKLFFALILKGINFYSTDLVSLIDTTWSFSTDRQRNDQ